MANKGRSDPNLFGGYTHYDEKGHKIGRSDPDVFGGYTHYDEKGHKTRYTSPGLFGCGTHYSTTRSNSYSSRQSGGNYSANSGGCYIATCVYASYDCSQVWTLRRYRDNTLAKNCFGRSFIKVYYVLSPTLVKWFGNTKLFRNFWKSHLDKMVTALQERGVEDTLYHDKDPRER